MLIFLLTAITLQAEEKPISIDNLPVKAQQFITQYYPDVAVESTFIENRASLTQYEVRMANGDALQFNKAGQWTEIKCKKGSVPAALIPKRIYAYIVATYPEAKIKEFEHDDRLYEVRLNNQLELTFSSSFKLLDIDRK